MNPCSQRASNSLPREVPRLRPMADADGPCEKKHQLCCEREARGELAVTAQVGVSAPLVPCEGVRVGDKPGCANSRPRKRGCVAFKRLKTPFSHFKGDFATHANHAQCSDAPLGSHQQRAAQLARPGRRLEWCKEEVVINECEV